MNSDVTAYHQSQLDSVQHARLRQMFTWTAIICALCFVCAFGLGVLFASPTFLSISGIIAVSFVVALLTRGLFKRGQVRFALLLYDIVTLAIAIAITAILPVATTAMTTVPFLLIVLLLPFLSARMMIGISVLALATTAGIFLIGTTLPPLLPPPPLNAGIALGLVGVVSSSATTLLLLWQFSSQLLATVAQTRATNAALEHARATLESEVDARTADLRAALTEVEARAATQALLLDENQQQRTAIREMSVPILPVSAEAIVVPLIGALDSERLQIMQEQTLHAIEQRSAVRYVLLDITGVPVVDTHVAQGLISIVLAARLLGAEVVLVGIRPEVAQTVVALGVDLRSMSTHQTLQDGIIYTLRRGPALAA